MRVPSIVRDIRKDSKGVVSQGTVVEEYQIYAAKRSCVYFNLMNRSRENSSEAERSKIIENYKNKNGLFCPFALDMDSSFYHQSDEYSKTSEVSEFKNELLNHLTNEKYFLVPDKFKDLWKQACSEFFAKIQGHYFHSKQLLSRPEKQVFISIMYCMLIEKFLDRIAPDVFSLVCKDNIDRGGMMSTLFYAYLVLRQGEALDRKRCADLVALAFIPALLAANRVMSTRYFERLHLSLSVLLKDGIFKDDNIFMVQE